MFSPYDIPSVDSWQKSSEIGSVLHRPFERLFKVSLYRMLSYPKWLRSDTILQGFRWQLVSYEIYHVILRTAVCSCITRSRVVDVFQQCPSHEANPMNVTSMLLSPWQFIAGHCNDSSPSNPPYGWGHATYQCLSNFAATTGSGTRIRAPQLPWGHQSIPWQPQPSLLLWYLVWILRLEKSPHVGSSRIVSLCRYCFSVPFFCKNHGVLKIRRSRSPKIKLIAGNLLWYSLTKSFPS